MIKFRMYYDKDAETTWLNEMASKGYAMTGFLAGFYTFRPCTPGEYTYQVDFGDQFFSVSSDYREFMTEHNIEIVQTWGMWIILRKRTSDGPFELYTDVDSSIEHYTKIRNMFKVTTIVEIIAFFMMVISYTMLSAETSEFLVLPFACMVLIAIFIATLMRATIHTNQIILQLKERKGDAASQTPSRMSPLLLAGLGLNCAALSVKSSVSPDLGTGISILAIVFMLIGIWQSKHIFNQK